MASTAMPEGGVDLDVVQLRRFATRLLSAAGIDSRVSDEIANHLIEAEQLGRRTHGLCNLSVYVEEANAGRMSRTSGLVRKGDLDGALLVDGQNSSGIWAVGSILDEMLDAARSRAVTTAVITDVHHTGCMGVYVQRVIDRGMILLMCSSNPVAKQVVPHGAREPLLSTNPIAFGSPADGGPLVLDMATSMVAGSLVRDYRAAGQQLPGAWVADDRGEPTRDSAGIGLLPLGAPEHGYKGTGLALMIEALTQGLGGWGRSSVTEGWRLAVFLQVFNPTFFHGLPALSREVGYTLGTIRNASPRHPGVAVRAPGDRATRHMQANQHTIHVPLSTISTLEKWARKLNIAMLEMQ